MQGFITSKSRTGSAVRVNQADVERMIEAVKDSDVATGRLLKQLLDIGSVEANDSGATVLLARRGAFVDRKNQMFARLRQLRLVKEFKSYCWLKSQGSHRLGSSPSEANEDPEARQRRAQREAAQAEEARERRREAEEREKRREEAYILYISN